MYIITHIYTNYNVIHVTTHRHEVYNIYTQGVRVYVFEDAGGKSCSGP